MSDERYMRRALELALRGFGSVEPNPMVGAVVVRKGRIVAEGWHEKFGWPHAEINAINSAGSKCKGSTLYVTLEPCTHFGKTPPCCDRVIEAGFQRVVVAARDPNPINQGKGVRRLRQAGIEVVEGVLKHDAERLNIPFKKFMQTGMPYVIAKWAMTLDGKIATHTGDSRWITSRVSRILAHLLRSSVSAVLVGVGTVIRDDPLLTCRIGRRDYHRMVHRLIAEAERRKNDATLEQQGAHRLRGIFDQGRVIAITDRIPIPFAPWLFTPSLPFHSLSHLETYQLATEFQTSHPRLFQEWIPSADGRGFSFAKDELSAQQAGDHELSTKSIQLRNPIRIIADSSARTPLSSRIVKTAHRFRTIIATTEMSPRSRRRALANSGCEVLIVPSVSETRRRSRGATVQPVSSKRRTDEQIDLVSLLETLCRMDILTLLVEGGAAILGSFLDQQLIDYVVAFIAPKLIGGRDAVTPIAGRGIDMIASAISLDYIRFYLAGDEIIVAGDVSLS